MIFCAKCGKQMKYYDTVKRIVRHRFGIVNHIYVERYVCTECRHIKRYLPDQVLPYKHYEKNIIKGFVSGRYSSDDIEFEDYPCEITVKKWKCEYKT